ncbi:MAG: aminodeoxychorismate lyase [Mycobacterium sp.]|nr:aminodeoxychorismate lyase [Mycobacterium sp.]
MSGRPSVLVTLDGAAKDPDTPLLCADDLAAVRGDGLFETLLVREGRACLVDAHLRRLVHSAAMLDLPEPDLPAWQRAIAIAATRWTAQSPGEGALRLVYSRGRESGGPPSAYLTVSPVADRVEAARRDGVSAVLLDRGLPVRGSESTPWLLAGAKTLSYAVNMAALRHSVRLGADDVIFVSSDGYILEGPRSTVVIAVEGRLLTPPPEYPILRGTTQQALFEVARAEGLGCGYEQLKPMDLSAAQGIWLVSSITLAARVHTLDGRALAPSPMAAQVKRLVQAAILGDG